MAESKEFGILGGGDDDDNDNEMPLHHHNNNNNKSQSNGNIQNTFNDNNRSGQLMTSHSGLDGKDRTPHRYKISPNRPNVALKLELKSIQRPRTRSQSPLRNNGLEEYIQQYEEKKAMKQQINPDQKKITMNLKMDDLLANVSKNQTYQTLDDFSFMTGDNEDIIGGEFNNNNNRRRRSKAEGNKQKPDDDDDDDINNGDDDNDNDDNDDDDDDDNKNQNNKNGNLKYKFTAVYRKDENTGSFQEQSKTVFETKQSKVPSRPPPPPSSHNYGEQVTIVEPNQDQGNEISQALAALMNNSKNLEQKLDKIDDLQPYVDTSRTVTRSPSPSPLPSLINRAISPLASSFSTSTITKVQNQPIVTSNSSSVDGNISSSNVLKKRNETFFNDFLGRSDDLITQTQKKLERLSKLETVNKTALPAPPKPDEKPIKAKPVPSPINDSKVTSSSTSLNEVKSQSNSLHDINGKNNFNKTLFLFLN
jgi:hypothetical protein